uniref:Protein containing DUF497 n=1 Tax=mine drainage metagenome TaxID=410659 RepID=E6QLP8_9ZZZZ
MSVNSDDDGPPIWNDQGMPDFEWHPVKAASNEKKHKVSFEEARTIFQDTHRIEVPDDWHSDEEQRYLGIGRSFQGRILSVYYTLRLNRIRIISARRAERSERDEYEAYPEQERDRHPKQI